jgi:hypothetical protein
MYSVKGLLVSLHCDKVAEIIKRKKGLLWLTVSVVSVDGGLALLLLGVW